MAKIAIIILAGKELKEGNGRLRNGLTAAKELKEAGHEVKIIFDGAGTEWIPEIEKEDNRYHQLYQEVKGKIGGACDFCAGAFQVKDEIEKSFINLMDEYEGHPSFAKLISEGFQIITF